MVYAKNYETASTFVITQYIVKFFTGQRPLAPEI